MDKKDEEIARLRVALRDMQAKLSKERQLDGVADLLQEISKHRVITEEEVTLHLGITPIELSDGLLRWELDDDHTVYLRDDGSVSHQYPMPA